MSRATTATRRGLACALLLAACRPAPTVTVLAASSLTDAFGDLERAYEQAWPGEDVAISFGGSHVLAAQLRQGFPADVFASADEPTIATLRSEGRVGAPERIASNRLVMVGAPSLEGLAQVERLVLGAAAAPIGRYTDALLDAAAARLGPDWRAAVDARVVSREPHVRLVLHKVLRGEADAAIVYATDVPKGVMATPIAPELAPPTWILQAAVPGGRGDRWMAFVRSDAARALLAARGFAPP